VGERRDLSTGAANFCHRLDFIRVVNVTATPAQHAIDVNADKADECETS
jgi:hypothetical protein